MDKENIVCSVNTWHALSVLLSKILDWDSAAADSKWAICPEEHEVSFDLSAFVLRIDHKDCIQQLDLFKRVKQPGQRQLVQYKVKDLMKRWECVIMMSLRQKATIGAVKACTNTCVSMTHTHSRQDSKQCLSVEHTDHPLWWCYLIMGWSDALANQIARSSL